MAYKMKGPSLLKMVAKEKKHFLERNKVGPIATEKKLPKEKAFVSDEKDMHISTNITEGSMESQELRRKESEKKKKYPKSYTKEDIKFLEEQHEDVVREEDKK